MRGGFSVRLFRKVRPKSSPYTMIQGVFSVQHLTNPCFFFEWQPNSQEQAHLWF